MSAPPLLRTLRLLWVLSVLLSLLPATLATPKPLYAQSETPLTIATERVDSFSIPSPGLFYHVGATCPFIGPNAAANTPNAVESPMFLWRNTVRAEGERTLQRVDDLGGPASCNPYRLYSNIVADENFIYWVDANGLVKLPVTANVGDTPTMMNEAYGFELPVELVDNGDHLIAVSNLPVVGGPIITTGGSYVERVDVPCVGSIRFGRMILKAGDLCQRVSQRSQ